MGHPRKLSVSQKCVRRARQLLDAWSNVLDRSWSRTLLQNRISSVFDQHVNTNESFCPSQINRSIYLRRMILDN
jgi:hypothetical protein